MALPLAVTAGARAASAPSTQIHLTPTQVAQALFVAGDVARLSQIPSGTESIVLEKILQQLYADNPSLPSAQAVSDLQGLQAALASGSQATSPATLTVMAGNERILAILHALSQSNPPAEVLHALAQVTDQALTSSSQSAQFLGQAFNASADSLDTLSFNAFSPGGVLGASASLAATNNLFGQARDALWKQASSESVFDSTQTLLAENPALQNSSVRALVNMLNADGSLDTSVGALQSLINGGVAQIDNQNCTLASGASGPAPSNCTAGALHDAQLVVQACPKGAGDTSAGCQSARKQAGTDATNELDTIAAARAADAAAAAALDQADKTLGRAEMAEAQAAAEIADDENQYLNYQSAQQFEKAGFDAAQLAVTLSVSEIDPVDAASGLLNLIGDALGFSFSGPDPNTIILQGIQNISMQLSSFEQYTQSAFHAVDAQLSNISNQVALLTAQITQSQQQLTQLATTLTTLQSSVDHLQSEVQSLFAQGARNDLATLVNQYIGYQQANGVSLSGSQFATAAGALFQDATGTALTQTVLNIPTGFDALHANSLVTGNDPFTLDSNINLFNFYGAQVTDAPGVTWNALTTSCAPNADLAHALCLPDPDFWATSARAFAQLLMENPSYVTPTRITQLNAIQQEGQSIANGLHQLSVNDAGSDVGGTGNKTLDAALAYFRYWGDRTGHPAGTPPSLWQTLKNVEQDYLSNRQVPNQPTAHELSYAGVNPWGAFDDAPDDAGVDAMGWTFNIPLCSDFAARLPIANASAVIPQLTPSTINFLSAAVLNAVRLGAGTVKACWTVDTTPLNQTNNTYQLTTTVNYTYVSGDGTIDEQVGQAVATLSTVTNCGDSANSTIDGVEDVAASWPGVANRNGNCTDISPWLALPGNQSATLPADVEAYVIGQIDTVHDSLQQGIYNQILSGGSTLTSGTSPATDVESAATRLAGANALLGGYISLGLPQALASDDALHSLVAGVKADTFDPASGGLPGTSPANDLPDQVVNLYKAALADITPSPSATTDPADVVANLVDQRAVQLGNTIKAHIVAPAQGGALQAHVRLSAGIAAAQTTSAVFAEENPYIGPTLDRLDETALVLNDVMNNAPATNPVSTTSTTASTPTALAPPVAKCTLKLTSNKVLIEATTGKATKGAPVRGPGTLSLTVKCDRAGKVKLTGKLTQLIGAKPQHGKQKSKNYRLGPVTGPVKAGKPLTLRVKLPAAAVSALGKGAHESTTFTATVTGPNGSGRASTKTVTLKATPTPRP